MLSCVAKFVSFGVIALSLLSVIKTIVKKDNG